MKPLESGKIKFNTINFTVMDWDLLMPLGICVVLPVMIVWLVMRTRQNETNKNTEIMLKAIASGATVDTEFFKSQQRGQKTIKERLLSRLTWGSIFSLIGVVLLVLAIVFANSYAPNGWNFGSPAPPFAIIGGISLAIGLALFVVFFVGKKIMAREMEAEAKAMEKK